MTPRIGWFAELQNNKYDDPQPTATLRLDRHHDRRDQAAQVYEFAASVERASAGEQWVVVPDLSNAVATVHLELMNATTEEARRGMQVLRACVATLVAVRQ